MDEKMDKKLEKLIDSALQGIELDTPNNDFTEKVMNRVYLTKMESSFSYRPIISNGVLGLMALVIFGASGYLFFTADFSSEGWFEKLSIGSWLNEINIPFLEHNFSTTMVYAVILLGIMVFVQTSLLKNYFDKRLA